MGMATVTVNNSFSTIKGLNIVDERGLRESLSYVVGGKSAFFSNFGVRRKSLLSKRGEFPTGVLHRVEDFLVLHKIPYRQHDVRRKPRAAVR